MTSSWIVIPTRIAVIPPYARIQLPIRDTPHHRHSRERGNPGPIPTKTAAGTATWVPAFAGTTTPGVVIPAPWSFPRTRESRGQAPAGIHTPPTTVSPAHAGIHRAVQVAPWGPRASWAA
jgi:hypothetical protein